MMVYRCRIAILESYVLALRWTGQDMFELGGIGSSFATETTLIRTADLASNLISSRLCESEMWRVTLVACNACLGARPLTTETRVTCIHMASAILVAKQDY